MLQTNLKKPHLFSKLLVFVLLLFNTNLSAQKKQIDSLKQLLLLEISDSAKVDNLMSISRLYQSINIDSVLKYSKKTAVFSESTNGYRLAEAYNNMGACHFYQANLDSANYYYQGALDALDKNNDSIIKSFVYCNMALMYGNLLDKEKEIAYYLKAISQVESNDKEVCTIYYNLSRTYMNSGFEEKGLEYLIKAYESSKKSKTEIVFDYATSNLASYALDNSDIEMFHEYMQRVDSLCALDGNPSSCYSLNYLNGSYHAEQRQFENALENYRKANTIAKEMSFVEDIMETTAMIARMEYALGKKRKAVKTFAVFDSLYQFHPDPTLGMKNFNLWAEYEASLGNYNTAYNVRLKWEALKDSVLAKEKREILIDSEKKYETEKKERAIAEQQVTIKEQELDLAQKQRQIAIWVGLGGILALLLGASFWTNKERQKRKEQEIVSLKSQQEVVRLEALVSGEEKERVRLAQDLHDGINGDLSVIKFKIDGVDKRKLPKVTHDGLDQALKMLDNAIDQVRRISHNLAPPSLQNFNLTEAIKQNASKMQSTHSDQIDFETFGDMPHFSSDQETALYRIVQELLNNIIKHAEAKETLIQLNHTEEHTELVIEDDGKGFDTKISKNGIGLQNIASRVAFLKGNLNIESSGEGSTFTITLPKNS